MRFEKTMESSSFAVVDTEGSHRFLSDLAFGMGFWALPLGLTFLSAADLSETFSALLGSSGP